MALLLLEQGDEHRHADNRAMSPGISLPLSWALYSERDGLSLVTAAEIALCMDSLAVYQVRPVYLPACAPRPPVSFPSCLLHLISIHSPALA